MCGYSFAFVRFVRCTPAHNNIYSIYIYTYIICFSLLGFFGPINALFTVGLLNARAGDPNIYFQQQKQLVLLAKRMLINTIGFTTFATIMLLKPLVLQHVQN